MPEGPEVAVLAEKLSDYFTKNKIHITIPKALKKYYIQRVDSKGKFIWFTLYNGNTHKYILSTLGLTGYWQVFRPDESIEIVNTEEELYKPTKKYEKFRITFANDKYLIYEDMRGFGKMTITDDVNELNKKLLKLGPDLLKNNVSYTDFKQILMKYPNKNIVKFFMNDQHILSGIGNYAIAEILYRAQISPHHKIGELVSLKKLYKSVIYILKQFYQLQGGTQDYYPKVIIKETSLIFHVYRRKKDIHGNKVITDKINGARTIYWVPEEQI